MSAVPHYVFQFAWKLLWLLPTVCLIIVSFSMTPTPSTPPQTLQCGTINPASEGTTSAEHSGICFWQAFQHCRAASLTYINENSNTYVFTTRLSASQCKVIENVNTTTGTTKTSAFTCSHLQAFRGGAGALILSSCNGNGNITIPVNPSIQ